MLRTGRVKESVYRRSVLRPLQQGRQGKGPDSDLLPVKLKMTSIQGWILAARRAVYGMENTLLAAGVLPERMMVDVLMPAGTEESSLKALFRELDCVCRQEKLLLLPGTAAVTSAVNTLILSVAGYGLPADLPAADSRPEAAGRDLVMVGHAGREGAAMLAIGKEEQLVSRYPASFIHTAGDFYADAGMAETADILRNHGALKIHAVGEGGVFGSLWELAASLGTGLEVEIRKIPIRQHTVEICEFFDLNPYMLLSGGCMLAVCRDGEEAVHALWERGMEAGIIGKTIEGNDRLIHYDTEKRYLEPPKTDEIYKIYEIL